MTANASRSKRATPSQASTASLGGSCRETETKRDPPAIRSEAVRISVAAWTSSAVRGASGCVVAVVGVMEKVIGCPYRDDREAERTGDEAAARSPTATQPSCLRSWLVPIAE